MLIEDILQVSFTYNYVSTLSDKEIDKEGYEGCDAGAHVTDTGTISTFKAEQSTQRAV